MIRVEYVLIGLFILWIREEIYIKRKYLSYKQGYLQAVIEIVKSWNHGINVDAEDWENRLRIMYDDIKEMTQKAKEEEIPND